MRPDGDMEVTRSVGNRTRQRSAACAGRQQGHGVGGLALMGALATAVMAAALLCSCREHKGTYDVRHVVVRSYRYVIDPRDEDVHVVVEIENTGPEMVEEAMVVVEGIGRSGEHRGEQRVTVQRLAPGERRCVAMSFTNRARLATVEVRVEPVPEEGR